MVRLRLLACIPLTLAGFYGLWHWISNIQDRPGKYAAATCLFTLAVLLILRKDEPRYDRSRSDSYTNRER